jgi:hypothetical protein
LVIPYIQKLTLFYAYVEPEMTTRLFDLAAIVSRVSLALSIFYPRCHPSKKKNYYRGAWKDQFVKHVPGCNHHVIERDARSAL